MEVSGGVLAGVDEQGHTVGVVLRARRSFRPGAEVTRDRRELPGPVAAVTILNVSVSAGLNC